jgi:hypothetical protein
MMGHISASGLGSGHMMPGEPLCLSCPVRCSWRMSGDGWWPVAQVSSKLGTEYAVGAPALFPVLSSGGWRGLTVLLRPCGTMQSNISPCASLWQAATCPARVPGAGNQVLHPSGERCGTDTFPGRVYYSGGPIARAECGLLVLLRRRAAGAVSALTQILPGYFHSGASTARQAGSRLTVYRLSFSSATEWS